jgi:MarR family transcriptional regulator, transcriptional regulator for hemolysin
VLKREESAGYMTNWAARLFARRIERRLKPLGIQPAYLPVIFALADGSALSQKALVARAAVEQPTMAATLKRMQRDRLIEAKADASDKRSVLYSLKAEARKAVEGVARAAIETNEEALTAFDSKEREQYLAMMQRRVRRLLELEERDGAND